MKNYNLKPLYIFLALFATGWIIKLSTQPKELSGTKIHFEQKGKYKNSFEKEMHETGKEIKEGIEKLQEEALKNDSIAIIPTYND